jgi:hypothetical protein
MIMYGRNFTVVKLSGTLRNPELGKKPYDKPTLIFSPPWSDWWKIIFYLPKNDLLSI